MPGVSENVASSQEETAIMKESWTGVTEGYHQETHDKGAKKSDLEVWASPKGRGLATLRKGERGCS